MTEVPGTNGQVLKKITKEGIGDFYQKTGQKVSVHYKGYFKDGILDNKRDNCFIF